MLHALLFSLVAILVLMPLNAQDAILAETLLLMELLADATLDSIWIMRMFVPLALIFLPTAQHVSPLDAFLVEETILLLNLDVLKYAVLPDALNVTTPRSVAIVSLI